MVIDENSVTEHHRKSWNTVHTWKCFLIDLLTVMKWNFRSECMYAKENKQTTEKVEYLPFVLKI